MEIIDVLKAYLKPTDKDACEGMKNALRELSSIEKLEPEIKAALAKV